MARSARTLFMLSLCLTLGASARAADPRVVEEALRQGEIAMAAFRYTDAATRMEQAFALDPNPLWLANAGYAWMLAGDATRAIDDLSRALADARLTSASRVKANERLERAKAFQQQHAQADAAEQAQDFPAAARAADAAHALIDGGGSLLRAATLWQQAGDLDAAEARYKSAAKLQGLTDQQRAQAIDGLAQIAQTKVDRAKADNVVVHAEETVAEPDEASSPVVGWVLLGTGVAAVGLGVTSFIVGSGERADGVAARDTLSQDEADAINGRAETWWNVGLVATGVGVAAAAVGIVLLATHDGRPATRGSVEVGGAPLPGGGLFIAVGRF